MLVRAKRLGYYDLKRRHPGDVFNLRPIKSKTTDALGRPKVDVIPVEKQFTNVWMERVDQVGDEYEEEIEVEEEEIEEVVVAPKPKAKAKGKGGRPKKSLNSPIGLSEIAADQIVPTENVKSVI